MILGNSRPLASVATELVADRRYLTAVSVPGDYMIAKLTLRLDGAGSGFGAQALRGCAYDALSGELLGVTDEVVIASGAALQWADFTFDTPISAGERLIGVVTGAISKVIRVIGDPVNFNLVTNPSLEGGGALWPYQGTSPSLYAKVASNPAHGSYSLQMGATLANNGNFVQVTPQLPPVADQAGAIVPGEIYSFTQRYVSTQLNGGKIELFIDWLNSGGGAISSTPAALRLNSFTGPQTLVCAAVAPAGAAAASLRSRWWGVGGGPTSVNFFMDAAQFSPGSSPSYVDGDTPGFAWLGTPASSASATSRSASDSYDDGPVAVLGATPLIAPPLPIFATCFRKFAPDGWSERQIAGLPVPDASAVFGSTGPEAPAAIRASCGWHGSRFAEEEGAFAIVKLDGPLSDFVGERVQITTNDRTTYAYIYDERDIIEDLSLTRRAFLDLAEANTDELDVIVTPMGGVA